MIKGYFGIPGSGKTTNLVKIALKELRRFKKRYDHIYTINFKCSGCIEITWDDLANFKFYNSLILIDEITLNADNRKFKDFSDEHRDFFILHRHVNCDVIWSTQNFDKVDIKIQSITQELWYMSKSVIPLLSQFTSSRRIYRTIVINEHTGDLKLGYRFCNFLESFFASNIEITYRRPLYKHFDSFDELTLANRPVYSDNVPIPYPPNLFERGKNLCMKIKNKTLHLFKH